MRLRRITVWVLVTGAAAIALYLGAEQIYRTGVEAGAEAGVQASREIGFTGRALQLRELLKVSDDLERANAAAAIRTLDMLAYLQYTSLEDDAAGSGLLKSTQQMKKEIERVREIVRPYCEASGAPKEKFDLCAEFAKRSNNAFQRTLEDSRR